MVNITIVNLQGKLRIPELRVKKLIRRILKRENFKKAGCINICFTNNALIRKLNNRFLNTNRITDVLAFNLSAENEPALLAEIAISAECAIKNARCFRNLPEKELLLYVAHGILHILGFNDHTKAQTQLMRNKEREYVDR
jgi:probable rRNA maturation factor